MDHTYYNINSPYYTSANNHYYWEPQLPPSIHIHPDSAAAQLGLTPADMVPILQEQREFLRNELRNELAQPPPALTRTTSTHHLRARAEPQPKPTSLSPQQEAARLGITPEELAAIGEDSIRDQAEWLAQDEVEWREREERRW
jgi:hypothetical protein